MRRLAVPTILIACLAAAPAAEAKLRLPRGADAPPKLPAGVVPAELPPVAASRGQSTTSSFSPAPASAAASASSRKGDRKRRRGGKRERRRDRLWATVNVCDTEQSPNALGVRVGLPGNARRERLYVRYTAQWWSGRRQEWVTVTGAGTSRWVYAGSSRDGARQAGWTFHFEAPPAGTTFVMRGVTEIAWRGSRAAPSRGRKARWAVVRRRTRLTETGIEGVDRGDPPGLSKAMCLIW